MTKLYCKVKAVKANDKGLWLQVMPNIKNTKDFDEKDVKVVFCTDKSLPAKEGTRLNLQVTEKNKILCVEKVIKVYEDKPQGKGGYKKKDDLPIKLGNAVTIANNLGKSLDEIPEYAAKSILPEIEKLGEVIAKSHAEMDDYSRGARLGQCLVIASSHAKDLSQTLTDAQKMFDDVCEQEKAIRESKA